jgi:hypothetical protein
MNDERYDVEASAASQMMIHEGVDTGERTEGVVHV